MTGRVPARPTAIGRSGGPPPAHMLNLVYYPIWHYTKALYGFFKIWFNFIKFFWSYFFSVPLLIKTLFSPWKKDISPYPREGLDINAILQTFASNLVSRGVGAAVRISIIIIALASELLSIAIGIILFCLWLIWPFLFMYSIYSKSYLLLSLSITTAIFSFICFRTAAEKQPSQLKLKEILKKKWSKAVWERVGIRPQEVPKKIIRDPERRLADFLKEKGIEEEDFKLALGWIIRQEEEKYRRKRFWREENLFYFESPFGDLIYGYTPTLDAYSEPLNALREYEKLIDRDDEINSLERVLSRGEQNNAIMVGEPGVGKMSIIQKLSRKIMRGESTSVLNHKRLILLDVNAALAGLNTTGEKEARMIQIFNEASWAGNIILVINNFHNFTAAGKEEEMAKKDISSIIAPFLKGGYFQMIAVTTYEGFHEYIEKNTALLKFFEKIEIKEPDEELTLKILMDSVREIESRVPARITVQALKEAIKKTGTYIVDTPFPEKALDVLEEAAIHTATKARERFVKPEHIDAIISEKTKVPLGTVEESEKEKLVKMEEFLHRRVVNQETAINEIASALRRSRLEIGSKKRPIGSFLFMGPTGVGKTETAKALAETYFGSEEAINWFFMSRFQGADAVEKLIGSKQKKTTGLLANAVREKPFSLLLLDELEKADHRVLNLLLQVLEEGWLNDAYGRKINFRNQIIIATSNAGANLIRERIEKGIKPEEFKKELIDYVLNNGIFRPEFLNRFDAIIIYKPLSRQNLIDIARLMLNGLKRRLEEEKLYFNFGEDLVEKIADLGYDPENGARPMRRVIQKRIEDLIAKKLLRGEIKEKEPFFIKAEEI